MHREGYFSRDLSIHDVSEQPGMIGTYGGSWNKRFLNKGKVNRQTDKQRDRQTERKKDRQTDNQTNRETDRQSDKQRDRPVVLLLPSTAITSLSFSKKTNILDKCWHSITYNPSIILIRSQTVNIHHPLLKLTCWNSTSSKCYKKIKIWKGNSNGLC